MWLREMGQERAISWSLHRHGNFQGAVLFQPFGMCCSLRSGVWDGTGMEAWSGGIQAPHPGGKIPPGTLCRDNPDSSTSPSTGKSRESCLSVGKGEGGIGAVASIRGICPARGAALGMTFTVIPAESQPGLAREPGILPGSRPAWSRDNSRTLKESEVRAGTRRRRQGRAVPLGITSILLLRVPGQDGTLGICGNSGARECFHPASPPAAPPWNCVNPSNPPGVQGYFLGNIVSSHFW